MAVRAAVDLARVLGLTPARAASERLLPGDFPRLCAALESSGMNLQTGIDAEARLKKLCGLYEPYVLALATWLLVPLPGWIPMLEEKEERIDFLNFDDLK